MNIDDELKDALRRVPAPPGLTDRAVARVKLTGLRRWPWRAALRIAAATAFVTTIGLGGYRYVDLQRQRQGQEAKQQLLLALQITAEKTDLAKRAIHD